MRAVTVDDIAGGDTHKDYYPVLNGASSSLPRCGNYDTSSNEKCTSLSTLSILPLIPWLQRYCLQSSLSHSHLCRERDQDF